MEQEKEIVHTSIAFGRTFTRQEWGDFCSQELQRTATIVDPSGFEWNVHDCCMNPHKLESVAKVSNFHEFKISTAAFNGRWFYGCSYEHGNSGGGYGCWLSDDKYFDNEQSAIHAAAESLMKWHGGEPFSDKAISELKALCRPVPVQLSLF